MELRCILCGSTGRELFAVEGRQLMQCPTCTLVWTAQFTAPDYHTYHRDMTYTMEDALFKNKFGRILSLAEKFHKKPGKLFEIGASAGNLLDLFAEDGWDCSGVEPSEDARNVAKKKGHTVLAGTFESIKIPHNSFDLVVINHTLEHVDDPLVVMKKIKDILKKEGTVIIGVPNFSSISANLLKRGWPYLLPEEHKWHFGPTSLAALVKKADLMPLAYEAASGLFDYQYPLKEIRQAAVGLKKRLFTDLITAPTAWIATQLNRGTNLLYAAQR